MTNAQNAQDISGRTALDSDESKIGKIGQVYLDDATGQPQWITVSTGLFGTKESFAPLAGSRLVGDDLVLAVTKAQVKDAPYIDMDGNLEDSDQDALYAHYANDETNADHTESPAPSGDPTMVRSEEQLHVGTESVETGRATLRKYVVTENVTQTVPVTHEEVRLEREPITPGAGDAAAPIGDDEQTVTLHGEQPVVSKETVPVERIGLATENVTEHESVDEEVRKEQVDTTGVDDRSQR